MDLSTYKAAFQSEAEEYLSLLNGSLLELEKAPTSAAPVNEIFRAVHTLKGMAATMGYEQLAHYAHEFEGVMDRLRKGQETVGRSLLDRLFAALDRISSLTSAAAEDRKLEEVGDWIAELRLPVSPESNAVGAMPSPAAPALGARVGAGGASPAVVWPGEPPVAGGTDETPPWMAVSRDEQAALAEAVRAGAQALQVDVELAKGCALKSVRVFMAFRALEGGAEVLKSDPDAKQLEAGNFESRFSLLAASALSPDDLRRRLEGIAEVARVWVRPVALAEGASVAPSGAVGRPTDKKPQATITAKAVQSVRVPIEKLDNLMNLVGELVISKIRLFQISRQVGNPALKDALAHFERVTNELQEEVVSARLIPIEMIFGRFPRMVRDLSRQLDKEVEFVTEGGEIELDRTVIDEIGDPLVHLIRNSLDHGIEPPDVRERAGKPRIGMLRLSARREKNQVVIAVEDDGNGIDVRRVREVALQRGVITAEQNAKMPDEEAIGLIATPGFSTAGQVSSVSGRGVGVDAVKSKVESFHGSFHIQSTVGQGSRFLLRLPLTLAIIQALLVRVRHELYAIPITNVVETFEMTEEMVQRMQQQEVVLLRDEVLPIVRLSRVLDIPNGVAEPERLRHVVVVEVRNHRVGIVVDDLDGQQEIAIKPMDKVFRGVRGFGGVTILGDGTIVLILDLAGLVG